MVFRQNQETMYTIFFKAVSETLLELGQNPKYLGAKLGVTAILHTWGQNLLYHPHIHCVVPGGGLTSTGHWKNSRKKFFIPVKILSKKFRGKFLAFMRAAQLRFDESTNKLNSLREYALFLQDLYNKDWVTYCKPPFGNTGKVIQYLGRYTHRVAISNNRILALQDDKVTFNWRDYADQKQGQADDYYSRRIYPPFYAPCTTSRIPKNTTLRTFGFRRENKTDTVMSATYEYIF